MFKRLIRLIIVLNFIMLVVFSYRVKYLITSVAFFSETIDFYELLWQNRIRSLTDEIKKLADKTYQNDNDLFSAIQNNLDELENLKEDYKTLDEKIGLAQKIDLENAEQIKQANIVIHNVTGGTMGSGTHIKLNGKHYILSCAHLVDSLDDYCWGQLDDGSYHPLKIIKISRHNDLSLFEIFMVDNLPYLEISEEYPKIGSKIEVIGNPADETDMITDGIISKKVRGGYVFTNIIYFGNSGGAILYKGKIVGVATRIKIYVSDWVLVNYGYGSDLQTIRKFLGLK